jgi:hypothetical protein
MLNKNVIIIGLTIFLMLTTATSVLPINADAILIIVSVGGPFFGVNLPFGHESPAFIGNVTQLAKMGFDSPQNAKLFIQLDSIALNSSSHPGNRTLTTPAINQITSIYNQMKSNNSTGGFTQIASVAMQTLNKRSFFDGAGRIVTVVPNSLDFSDTLKFGTLGAEIVCGIGPYSKGGDFADKMKSGQCVAGGLGAAAVKSVTIS